MTAGQRMNSSLAARRLAQACAVSSATFLSSGLGLLMFFFRAEHQPEWLQMIVIVAAATVVVTFLGWLILGLASLVRNQPHPR